MKIWRVDGAEETPLAQYYKDFFEEVKNYSKSQVKSLLVNSLFITYSKCIWKLTSLNMMKI